MTYTFDTTATTPEAIAGLSLILRPISVATPLPALLDWFPDLDPPLVWVPIAAAPGLVRLMPVLPQPDYYPALLQLICEQLSQQTAFVWEGRAYEVIGVDVEPDNLYLLQVALTSRERLPTSLERAIHAQCLEWFAIANPELAEQLHEPAISPIALSLKPVSPRQVMVKIGLLQPQLLAPLLWGLSSDLGRQVTLANTPCRLGNQVKVVATERFEQLFQLPALETIELQFCSPTSFKQGDTVLLFPLPELVFASLLKRWNAFAPDPYQLSPVEWQGWVSAYQLETAVLHLRGGIEIGFQGWTKYRFPNPEQARLATLLAQFAEFSGIGRKTTMGMGQAYLKP